MLISSKQDEHGEMKPCCGNCGEILIPNPGDPRQPDGEFMLYLDEKKHRECARRAQRERDRLVKEQDDALLRDLIDDNEPEYMPPHAGSTAFRELDTRAQKKGILKKYLHREPTRFHQMDVFFCEGWDDVIRPDDKGVGVMGGETFELMSGCANVRVLIVPGSPKEKVIHGLRRIIEWIESDGVDPLKQ
jgi:hypothetical protein